MALALPVLLTRPHPAAAQEVPPPEVIPPTRGEIEAQSAQPPAEAPAQLEVEGDVPRTPCALARPEFESIRFTPTEVVFEDLKGLGQDALRAAYQPYIGTEQPIAIVCDIRDRATAILRDAGYIASVEVPEQRVAEGRLRFNVVMAKLVSIRVRGNAGRSERKIASYLEPLTGQEVFNRFDAERALLLASDLPGYSVRLSLRSAGAARGEVIGDVTVTHVPFMADANVQNFGSHVLGRWGGMVRGQLFGLTGLGDRTSFSLYSSLDFSEQQTLQVAHEFRPGRHGLTLGGSFTYSWTNPDLDFPGVDIRAKTLFTSFEASYPLVRTQEQSIRGAIGFELANQDVEFNTFDLSRDRLRVAYLRLSADAIEPSGTGRTRNYFEPRWRLGGVVEVRRGLDIFGASPDCRVVSCGIGGPSKEANPTATVFRAAAQGELRPARRITLAGSVRSQYSSSPLLNFEEFSAGNYTVGRGYDPATITGDRGVGVQGEIRVGSLLPKDRDSIALEPFIFFDHAAVRNEDRFGDELPGQNLSSAGGGLRAAFGDRLRLDMTLAAPLDRIAPGVAKPDPRLLISLSTRLWPWSFR